MCHEKRMGDRQRRAQDGREGWPAAGRAHRLSGDGRAGQSVCVAALRTPAASDVGSH